MSKKIDLTGQTINRLVVIREAGRKNGKVAWLCRCLGKCGNDCGKEVVVREDHLRNGDTQSCGCLKRERAREILSEQNTIHGCAYEPWYHTYAAMMVRCGHRVGGEEHKWHLYRNRGITVCELWRNSPRDFGEWLLAHGWNKGLQVDRIDNSKGYSPENCRVVSCRENLNNRRNTVKLNDGTSLAMFCSSIGIETFEAGKKTKQYGRIQHAWIRGHKPHPELMQALREDTDKQLRLLEITKLKVRRAELMIDGLREILASKQTA